MFPMITSIKDVEGEFDDCFIVKAKEGIVYVNYKHMGPDTFPDDGSESTAMRREFRGIAFDEKTGVILSRPFQKFFNMGERKDIPDLSRSHKQYEKLDGSMVRPLWHGKDLRWGTKAGVTDVGMMAERFTQGKEEYERFAIWCNNNGCTPIFEYVGPHNKVVLDYKEDMILLALRSNYYGTYCSLQFLGGVGYQGKLPPIAKVSSSLLADVKASTTDEGIVLYFADGEMWKVKSDWYVKAHRGKEILEDARAFLRLHTDGDYDDVYPTLTAEDQARADELTEVLWWTIDEVREVGETVLEYINRMVYPSCPAAPTDFNGRLAFLRKYYAQTTKDSGWKKSMGFRWFDELTKEPKLRSTTDEFVGDYIWGQLEKASKSTKAYDKIMGELSILGWET